jgi:hypothetical protein
MMNKAGIIAIICFAALLTLGHCQDIDRTGVRGATNNRELQTNSVVFYLINAATDTIIATLNAGSVVNLGSVAPSALTIQVLVNGFTRRSVKISLTGAATITRTESGTYALCGNAGTDFAPCPTIVLGNYNVLAELYSESGATGSLVTTSSVSFTLTNTAVPTAPALPPVRAPTTAPVPVVAPVAAPFPSTCTVPKVRYQEHQFDNTFLSSF